MNTVSSIVASVKRILSNLFDILFVCSIVLDPEKFLEPHMSLFLSYEKKSSPLNSSPDLISSFIQECVYSFE